jgi:hypothetical protein
MFPDKTHLDGTFTHSYSRHFLDTLLLLLSALLRPFPVQAASILSHFPWFLGAGNDALTNPSRVCRRQVAHSQYPSSGHRGRLPG